MIIRPVAEARPDSDQAMFSKGLAALAVADAAVRAGTKPKRPPAKEHFDLAIHTFRGMLVKHPTNLRVGSSWPVRSSLVATASPRPAIWSRTC